MKKANVLGVMLCVILLVLTGCGSSKGTKENKEAAEKKKLQIGISFDSFVIERWLRDRDVFVSTAEGLGAEVNVQNANGDVQEQIEQIEYFIEKKMDVITIIANDGDQLQEVVKKAQDQGIIVICYDRLIRNVNCDLYISFDNEMVGRLMGEALLEAMPEGGKIFSINGSQSDYNVLQVQNGLHKALDGSNLKIVFSAYCDNWLSELAFDRVIEGLEVTGEVDGLMCGNDDLASSAIRALAERRLAGKVPVVAQDADLSGCQRIVEGTQYMTVYKSVDELAKKAAILAVALGNGEDISAEGREIRVTETIDDGTQEVPYYRIEPVAVTAQNMDEIIVDSGFHRKDEVYLNIVRQDETEEE